MILISAVIAMLLAPAQAGYIGARVNSGRTCTLEVPGRQPIRLHDLLFLLDIDSVEARKLKAHLKSKIKTSSPTLEEELIRRAQNYITRNPRDFVYDGNASRPMTCNDVSFDNLFVNAFPVCVGKEKCDKNPCKDLQDVADMINAVKYESGTKVNTVRCTDPIAAPAPVAVPRPPPPVAVPKSIPTSPMPAAKPAETSTPESTPAPEPAQKEFIQEGYW